MRKNKLTFVLLFAALLAPLTGQAQNRRDRGDGRGRPGAPAEGHATNVRAILIRATKDRSPTDRQIAQYESILRSYFPTESFHYIAEGSASVPAGGKSSLNVEGQQLELQSEGGTVFVRTGRGGASLAPGGPGAVFVVGSGSAIIVIAR